MKKVALSSINVCHAFKQQNLTIQVNNNFENLVTQTLDTPTELQLITRVRLIYYCFLMVCLRKIKLPRLFHQVRTVEKPQQTNK